MAKNPDITKETEVSTSELAYYRKSGKEREYDTSTE